MSNLEASIGDPRGFTGDDDVTSIYEGLQFLRERTLEGDNLLEESFGKETESLKKSIKDLVTRSGQLDATERSHRVLTDKLEERMKTLNASLGQMKSSMEKLKENFLTPLGRMYKDFVLPNKSGQNVLFRLEKLEEQLDKNSKVKTDSADDLFGAGLTGFYDEAGSEMGLAAQYKHLNTL